MASFSSEVGKAASLSAMVCPHMVYDLGSPLAGLGQNEFIQAATLTGWRYLLQHEASIVGSIEIYGKDSQFRFGSFSDGLAAGATMTTIVTAESTEEVGVSNYELSVLRDASAGTWILWLRSQAEQPDVFYTIISANPLLKGGQPVSEGQLRTVLGGSWQESSFDDRPKKIATA